MDQIEDLTTITQMHQYNNFIIYGTGRHDAGPDSQPPGRSLRSGPGALRTIRVHTRSQRHLSRGIWRSGPALAAKNPPGA